MKKIGLALSAMTLTTLACGGDFTPAGDERRPAPSLELALVDGSGTFSLEEQKGKVILVDFWATWCVPCLAELPALQRLHESYDPEEFTMVGIVLESGSQEEIDEFIREKSITYPNLLGEDGSRESFGPFLGYPTKYLIDKEGFVVKRYFGAAADQVAEDVEQLVRNGSLGPAD